MSPDSAPTDAPRPGAQPTPADPQPTAADPQPTIAEAPRARRRRAPILPLLALVGAVLLLAVGFVGGVAAERSGALVAAPEAPSPSVTPAPASSGSPGAPPSPGGSDAPTPSPTLPPLSEDEAFALVQQAWELLHEHYVGRDELDERELAYGAIDGLAQAVGDTGHTAFETPADREASNDALQGRFVGIGIYVDDHEDGIRVAGVIPRSPAAGAGLGVGDVIIGVDGTSLEDLSLSQAGALIRGAEGTPLTLEVDPAGPPGPRPVRLVRAAIDVPTVEWAMVPGTSFAHVRVLQFSSGAAESLGTALGEAREAGAAGVVLDLRGNPGGFVHEAVGVASQFLASGVVYQTEDAQGTRTPSEVQPGGRWTDRPVVVLVDRSTASSAEIVASALQDAGRGPVIGEATFGTGTVLAEFGLEDGSALRIGTVRWLTADGRAIWHEGLDPDVPASLPEGVDPLSPPEVGELAPGELDAAADTVLLEGLRRLASATEG